MCVNLRESHHEENYMSASKSVLGIFFSLLSFFSVQNAQASCEVERQALLVCEASLASCTSNFQCPGSQICTNGVCVNPPVVFSTYCTCESDGSFYNLVQYDQSGHSRVLSRYTVENFCRSAAQTERACNI